MNSKESNKSHGFGTEHKKNVSVRSDRVGGHGDMQMAETKSSFSKSQNDTKKA